MIASSTERGRWRPSSVPYGPGPVWRVVLLSLLALILFVAITLFLELQVVILAAALLGMVALAAVWRWPYAAVVMLVVFGSVHEFLMLLVLFFTGSPAAVKVAQLWKEALLLSLLVVVIQRAFARRQAPRVHLVDLAVLAFMLWAAAYLLYPSSIEDAGLSAKLFGLRLDAFPLVAYFVGRGLQLRQDQLRRLLLIFAAVVAVIAVIAVLEFMAPNATNAAFQRLGGSAYAAIALSDTTHGSTVRFNSIAGVAIPRASSLLLSDLGLAFYMLLGVPLLAALYLRASSVREKLRGNSLLLIAMAATALTVTRSAMLALVPMLVGIMMASRRAVSLLAVLAQAAIGTLVLIFALNLSSKVLELMFSTDEGSAHAHLQALQQNLQILQQDPFGRGLGTAGPVSQQLAVLGGVTNESWYFQLSTEIGAIGALLWVLVLLVFGIVAFRRSQQVTDPWLKVLCLTMTGSTIGFSLVSFTLHAWSGLTTSIIFWLLAGVVVSAPSLQRHFLLPLEEGQGKG